MMTLEDKKMYTSHEHKQKSSSVKSHSQSSLIGLEDSTDLYKPDWRYWPKLHDNNMPKPYEDDTVFGKHVVSGLPPIDLKWRAEPVVDSFGNMSHHPGGGNKAIFNEKIKWRSKSKINSFQNINYKTNPASPRIIPGKHYLPAGAELNLINAKYEYVGPKVGSLENADHTPRGGDLLIPQWKLRWNKKSKVGSFDNINHQPGGGEMFIMNQHLEWRERQRVRSWDNLHQQPGSGRLYPYEKTPRNGSPRLGSGDNLNHSPRTGHVVQNHMKLPWEEELELKSKARKREISDD